MIAAIPYFELPVYNLALPGLGNLPIDPWATLVCLGFVLGLEMSRSRAIKLGLDIRDIVDGAVFIVGMGFLFGHIITVVGYYPERLRTEGIWSLLKLWEGFSSIGGFMGALLGTFLFYKYIRPRDFWRHADVIAFGFPFGWIFGRMGCASVHDHVGKLTTFPLAMDFDHGWGPHNGWGGPGDPADWVSGIRHELGMYEATIMIPVCIIWYLLGRKDRVPGYFTGLFAVVYPPIRFGLDFLRNADLAHQDARYYGLTPAQYGVVVMFGLGIAMLATRDWKGFKPWALDGSEKQGERANAPESTA